ncbi:hypothetical protein K2Q00_03565 [Patescibacteria group bacterium]|nr:hypothetical protein [Patescibacteria group bacterium]
MTFQSTAKILLLFGLATFLFLGVFGMPHSMIMGPDGNMTMSNCPFMSGQAAVCNMNPLEHIAAWQSMFTSTFQQNGSTLILLLLAALALALVWTRLRWPTSQRALRPLFRIARRETYLPPPLLQELFSNGILNPKVF